MCHVQQENCKCRACARLAAGLQWSYSHSPDLDATLLEIQDTVTADFESIQGKGKLACQRQIAIGNLGAGYMIGVSSLPDFQDQLLCLYDAGVEYLKNEKDICHIIKTGKVGEALSIAIGADLNRSGQLITYANLAISGTDNTPFTPTCF